MLTYGSFLFDWIPSPNQYTDWSINVFHESHPIQMPVCPYHTKPTYRWIGNAAPPPPVWPCPPQGIHICGPIRLRPSHPPATLLSLSLSLSVSLSLSPGACQGGRQADGLPLQVPLVFGLSAPRNGLMWIISCRNTAAAPAQWPL